MFGVAGGNVATLPLTLILKLEKKVYTGSINAFDLYCAQKRMTRFGCVPVSE